MGCAPRHSAMPSVQVGYGEVSNFAEKHVVRRKMLSMIAYFNIISENFVSYLWCW